MFSPMQTITKYLDAWNETNPARRRAAIDALFTEQCHYVDPMADVSGRDALDGLIAGVQKQFTGFTFALRGTVDTHHGQARFTWQAGPAGAPDMVIGFDVVVLEGDRIGSVYGFLDKVPG